MFPRSVASSGPARTGSPAASAVQRQSSSLRAPPPTTWISRGDDAGDGREQVDRLRVLQRETLEDAAHDRARLDRLRLACVRAERAHPRRHVAGIGEGGVVGIDERLQRGRVLRERDELVERVLPALLRPHTAALVDEPEPGDVAKQAERAADAALVGEIRGERRVGDHRRLDLETDERPRARADEDRAGLPERDCRPRRSRCRASRPRRPRRREASSRPRPRALSGASRVPGWTTSGSSRVGTSRRSSRSVAQPPVCGSKHCVVVAFVNSDVVAPQSQ